MSNPLVLGVIPARGGSKGVPRKNLVHLAGKPLVQWAIDAALECPEVTDVVVTTDSEEIRALALGAGAEAPFIRPADLATDTALAIPTVQHAVQEMETRKQCHYDYVVMLQPTAPLRDAQDISSALRRLFASGCDGIISVVHVGNTHPYKMKVFEADDEGALLLDYESDMSENPPRQSLPPVYIVNGAVYATRRDVLMDGSTFKGLTCLGYVMPAERSVNVDTEYDFIRAEYELRRMTRS